MSKEFYKNNKDIRVININNKPKENKPNNKFLYLYTPTIILLISWYLLLFSTHYILLKKEYITIDCILIIFPLILIINHLYNLHKKIINMKSDNLENNIKEDLENELNFAKLIPVIIFGLGVFLPSKYKELILPYLLLSIILGTIIPFVIVKLGEEGNSLEILILKDTVQYCSQAIAFTLILPALLYPLFIILKKK